MKVVGILFGEVFGKTLRDEVEDGWCVDVFLHWLASTGFFSKMGPTKLDEN